MTPHAGQKRAFGGRSTPHLGQESAGARDAFMAGFCPRLERM